MGGELRLSKRAAVLWRSFRSAIVKRLRRASKLLRRPATGPRSAHSAASKAADHVVIAGVRVSTADADTLVALLRLAGDQQLADRLAAATTEGTDVNQLSIDERLAIQRTLEECPGHMLELRARLLSEPQPTWRQKQPK